MPHVDYYKNGKRIKSVTEIVKVLGHNKYLLAYYAKHGLTKVNAILESMELKREHIQLDQNVLNELKLELEHFWKDGEALANEAAERGKTRHADLESPGEIALGNTPVTKAIRSWLSLRKIALTETEKHIISKPPLPLFHGTLDAVGFSTELNREGVIDWKFTNSLRKEYMLQVAGYDLGLGTGATPRWGCLLRISETKRKSKEDSVRKTVWGTRYQFKDLYVALEECWIDDLTVLHPLFLACKTLLDFIEGSDNVS